MISVTVKLDAGLGADLDNFTITAQPSATQIDTLAGRAALLVGVTYVTIPDDTTSIDVTSTGLCTDSINIVATLIPAIPPVPDTQPPGDPLFHLSPVVTETTATFTWDEVFDDVAVTGYELSKFGVLQETVPPNIFTWEATGLTHNTEYNFQILAIDAAGNKSAEDSITIDTVAIPITVYQQTLKATDNSSPVCATVGNNFFKYSDDAIPAVNTQFYNESPGVTKWLEGDGNWYQINNTSSRLRIASGNISAVAGCF
jgi:hypothetical protein